MRDTRRMATKTGSKHAASVAKQCVRNARALLGFGWAHVSSEIRWGLVCAEILAVQRAQDAGNDPARVLAFIEEITAACAAALEPR